jgi:hypothetical protein
VTESDKHAVVIVIGEVGACALRMPQSGAGVGHLSGQEWVRPEEALTARPNSSLTTLDRLQSTGAGCARRLSRNLRDVVANQMQCNRKIGKIAANQG